MRVEGVCESARARSPLSEPDKVWLTAADALARAASPPFTASPSTHTPHIASILIGGGRVPRDFYVGHNHARTHACLRFTICYMRAISWSRMRGRMCVCVYADGYDFAGNDERAPSPSQALNLRPWLFVFEATMLARYAFDRQRPRPVAPPDPPDPGDVLFLFFLFGFRFGS